MKTRFSFPETRGSALVAALAILAILSVLAGTVISTAMNRHITINRADAWDRALVGAESGVSQGIANLEATLNNGLLVTGTQTMTFNVNGTGDGAATVQVTYRMSGVNYASGTSAAITSGTIDKTIRPYYNIVSSGTVTFGATRGVAQDSRDVVLRRLNISGAVKTASRTVNVWLKPKLSNQAALTTRGLITMNNHNINVDSFDSSGTSRNYIKNYGTDAQSWPTGVYNNAANGDPMMGTIATNGQLATLGSANIWGDAMTNGGVVTGDTNVHGDTYDDFSTDIASVGAPTWYTSSYPKGITVTTSGTKSNGKPFTTTTTYNPINTAVTVTGGPATSPKQIVVDSISLSGNNDILTFTPDTTGNSGNPTDTAYFEVYVLGDLSTKGGGTGNGSIVLSNGAHVTFYIGGNVDVAGNGIVNQTDLAANLTMYGVKPPTGTTQTWSFGGTSTFVGTVDAPDANLVLAGTGVIVGSLTGATAEFKGDAILHYDEVLANNGVVTGFSVLGWFEETKPGI